MGNAQAMWKLHKLFSADEANAGKVVKIARKVRTLVAPKQLTSKDPLAVPLVRMIQRGIVDVMKNVGEEVRESRRLRDCDGAVTGVLVRSQASFLPVLSVFLLHLPESWPNRLLTFTKEVMAKALSEEDVKAVEKAKGSADAEDWAEVRALLPRRCVAGLLALMPAVARVFVTVLRQCEQHVTGVSLLLCSVLQIMSFFLGQLGGKNLSTSTRAASKGKKGGSAVSGDGDDADGITASLAYADDDE